MVVLPLGLLFMLFIGTSFAAIDETTVKIKQGLLKGRIERTLLNNKKYYAYYGVPYAAPPVGDLRFMPPKYPTKWKATSEASSPNSVHCPQMGMFVEHISTGSEDCLFLNVYTPIIKRNITKEQRPLSVMVWIHGGGFVTGSGNMNLYGPDFFLEDDVVVITLNYRLGVFGFLQLEEDVSGNMGLKDIIQALRWVRDNVAVFGGDPNSVTIFGSEAGGSAVSLLILSPMAKGLFSKAISQSGSSLSPKFFHLYAKDSINRLAKFLRKDATSPKPFIKSIKDVDPLIITESSSWLYDSTESRNMQNIVTPFAPVAEKKINAALRRAPEQIYEYEHVIDVPFMVGYNSKESIAHYRGIINNPHLLDILNYNFQFLLPYKGMHFKYNSTEYIGASNEIRNLYFKKGIITSKSADEYIDYTSDRIIYPIHKMISIHLQNVESPLYFYRFAYDGPFNIYKITTLDKPENIKGASNGDELCYLFKCGAITNKYKNIVNKEGLRAMRKLTRLWTNFAKYGNPTPNIESTLDGLLWKAATEDALNCLEIDDKFRMTTNPDYIRMKFWDDFYDDYAKNQTIRYNNEL